MISIPLSGPAGDETGMVASPTDRPRMTQWALLTQLTVPTRLRIQLGDPTIQQAITQHMTQLTQDPTRCPPIHVFPQTFRIWKYWTWFEAAKALGWQTVPIYTGQHAKEGASPADSTPMSVHPLTRYLLKSRHQSTCEYCGKNLFGHPPAGMSVREWNLRHRPTLDHRIPRSRGGTSHLTNLAVVCAACNMRKSDRIGWRIPLDLVYEAIEVNRRWPQ